MDRLTPLSAAVRRYRRLRTSFLSALAWRLVAAGIRSEYSRRLPLACWNDAGWLGTADVRIYRRPLPERPSPWILRLTLCDYSAGETIPATTIERLGLPHAPAESLRTTANRCELTCLPMELLGLAAWLPLAIAHRSGIGSPPGTTPAGMENFDVGGSCWTPAAREANNEHISRSRELAAFFRTRKGVGE